MWIRKSSSYVFILCFVFFGCQTSSKVQKTVFYVFIKEISLWNPNLLLCVSFAHSIVNLNEFVGIKIKYKLFFWCL